jgi:hypothetical protein
MLTKVTASTAMKFIIATLLLAFVCSTFLPANTVYAKDGDIVHRGIIQQKPATGLQGTWKIGGKIFKTTARTQFDQLEGPLVKGACAKVKIRNGAVKEIDSEPLSDC